MILLTRISLTIANLYRYRGICKQYRDSCIICLEMQDVKQSLKINFLKSKKL